MTTTRLVVPAPTFDKLYRAEILGIVQEKIDEHPRSHQLQIGPSEIGGCPRKVAYKVAYGATPSEEEKPGGWAAHRGTIIHEWLDHCFKGASRFMPDGSQRFFSDLKLDPVSEHVNGGTLDLYDLLTQTVIDWKAPGSYTMDAVRGGKYSEGYYVQSNTYGYGLEVTGKPVARVMLAFLPACGDDLHGMAKGAIFAGWPYERQVAIDAINNVRRLKVLFKVDGVQETIESQEMRSDFCGSCPAFVGSKDRRATCPGAAIGKTAKVRDTSNPFA